MKTYSEFADELFTVHPGIRVDLGPGRHFSPEQFHTAVDRIASAIPAGILSVSLAGESYEQRPIRLFTVGSGPVTIFLWSQMHGDESTATAAIADILKYIGTGGGRSEVDHLLSRTTIHFLPMLNPDGAARRRRRTAQDIDMNRDALAFRSPEAVLLKKVRDAAKPAYGYNLHDQELSTVGETRRLTALALLAPAFDAARGDNEVRSRAKRLCAAFARIAGRFAPGGLARYDDTFEPRAFGDNMQKWGTSTMLVESGHAPGDPDKESIRRLNFTGILATLFGIATGELLHEPTGPYDLLPPNFKRAYDCIIRSVTVEDGGKRFTADLGLSAQVDTHSEPPLRLVDLGDLHTFTAMEEIDGRKKSVPRSALKLGEPFDPSLPG